MFAKGTLLLMANGGTKTVETIVVGEMINGGSVTMIKSGLSDDTWYKFNGVHLTGKHIVFEGGEWKYAEVAVASIRIPPHDMYYTLNCTNHRLFGINNTTLTDDDGIT